VSDPPGATSILKRDAELVQAHLRQVLASYKDAPKRLLDALEYSVLAGGKRLRPALVLEAWRACGGAGDSERSALAAAGAIELIHTFSLVHDDLPAMDDDDLRRGKPTNHRVFGEAMAILAGDAMTTIAFELLARDAAAAAAPALIRELAAAAGPAGMIGGQVIDMEGQNTSFSLDQLVNLHRMKTGALLTAACRMGAIAAEAHDSAMRSITDYGLHVGLAFQIVDDLLDVTSTPQQVGKLTGKDARKGKNTYPALMGIEASRRESLQRLQLAIDAVAPLGERALPLVLLARFVVEREA
jgi:geranylgeranyl diphosphate synthase type II